MMDEKNLVMAYELGRNRIALWSFPHTFIQGIKLYVVTNTFTGKAIPCINYEHARDIYDLCIGHLGGAYVYCNQYAGMSSIFRN